MSGRPSHGRGGEERTEFIGRKRSTIAHHIDEARQPALVDRWQQFAARPSRCTQAPCPSYSGGNTGAAHNVGTTVIGASPEGRQNPQYLQFGAEVQAIAGLGFDGSGSVLQTLPQHPAASAARRFAVASRTMGTLSSMMRASGEPLEPASRPRP